MLPTGRQTQTIRKRRGATNRRRNNETGKMRQGRAINLPIEECLTEFEDAEKEEEQEEKEKEEDEEAEAEGTGCGAKSKVGHIALRHKRTCQKSRSRKGPCEKAPSPQFPFYECSNLQNHGRRNPPATPPPATFPGNLLVGYLLRPAGQAGHNLLKGRATAIQELNTSTKLRLDFSEFRFQGSVELKNSSVHDLVSNTMCTSGRCVCVQHTCILHATKRRWGRAG